MSNSYKELKDKQMAETNAFPIKAAFGDEQFRKVVEEWNLSFDENSDNYFGNEYGYTGCVDDTLEALGISRETLQQNAAMSQALAKDVNLL